MHDVAFPVASTDVQSDRANEVNSGLWPVNWADFNEPVPWSAYAGGQGMTFPTLDSGEVGPSSAQYCKTAICGLNSVIPGEYNPWMILPQAIKHLDPEWADCDIPNDFTWFDPPIALHNAPAFLTTTPPDPVSTPAAPASSASALPVQTSDPAPSDPPSIDPPTNDPPTNDFPTNSDPPTNDPPTTNDPPSNNPATSGETPNNPASSRQAPADAASSPADPPALAGSTVRNHAPGSLGPSNTEGGFPSNSRPTGNGNAPGPSPIGAPAQASRPQITAGPTVIPIAPDGQGLVIHSPTTFAPSGSAVIGGTTFHLSYGVLTMVSAGGTSSITVGDASHNGIGTVIGLGTGGAFTITTAGGSLVFDVETTIENGDPAQTVGDVIVSVGSDGVQISELKKGGKTSIAFTDVEGLGVSGAPFTEVASNGGSDAASTHKSGDSTIDTQSELAITSRLVLASSRSSLGGNGLADTAATASASKIGLDGSNRGSGTSVPPSTTSNTDEGAARSVPIPWYLGLLSMCILALHI
ncbi:hypothetical protein SLS60_010572 [Paraconiothyrium brasiliense]|uniref:Uncharacterized protein n=1 Tax=Paraconiothyrium brasiliense TaxID=300254 RepID=A0ABR3QNV2_9PLEO